MNIHVLNDYTHFAMITHFTQINTQKPIASLLSGKLLAQLAICQCDWLSKMLFERTFFDVNQSHCNPFFAWRKDIPWALVCQGKGLSAQVAKFSLKNRYLPGDESRDNISNKFLF